jgi:hypothetical protein
MGDIDGTVYWAVAWIAVVIYAGWLVGRNR